MRTLRLSLIGTVILVLLGGPGSVVIAQDEETALDPYGPSIFTLTPGDPLKEGEWVYTHGPYGSAEFLGIESVFPVEASDPRISGTWTEIYDFRGWEAPDDTGMPFSPAVYSAAVRIDNEDGAWVGTYGGFGSAVGGQEWIQLRGEGAYEGLAALIQHTMDFAAETSTYEGAIVPGVLPGHPEPIQTPAAAGAEGDTGSEAVGGPEPGVAVAVTPVTGEVVDVVWDDSQMDLTSEGDVNYGRGMRVTETYEWSDPRLPAVKTTVLNFNSYPGGETGRGILGATTLRLDGPDGAWVGGATTTQYADGHGFGCDTYVGEGAYEGLVAFLQCTSTGCEGQIFEGELPPMPDPVEPAAE